MPRHTHRNSEKLWDRARKVSPGGVHSPVRAFRGVGGVPRFIKAASGAWLEDVDGNRFVDFCLSWGPLILGHRDPEVREAVREAIDRGWSYGAAEPHSLELAELITSELPWVERVRFVSSGTEAVMAALRVARAATGRPKVVKFDGCYHGHADSMLVRAGSGLAEMASPDSAGVTSAVAGETVVLPLDDLEALQKALELRGSEIAAVIFEAIPANNGLLLQREGYLAEAARLCRAAGALVLLDEVITGFRVGFGGVAELTGVRPDLVTYGKVIGGGFPVGAYGGRAELMDLVAPSGPVYQAGTLSANPVSMAAGLATLRKLRRENPYAQLAALTEKLARDLEAIARSSRRDVPLKVQSFASIFWPVFGRVPTEDGVVRAIDQAPAAHKGHFTPFFHSMLERGIYLAPSAFEVGFLSTAHGESELGMLLEAAGKALA